MGVKDTITKDYMNDPRIFADAFNYYLYNGRQVVLPERLHPIDTTAIGTPYGKDGAGIPVQKFRDSLKYLTAMKDETAAYLLMGIEDQSEIHYAMPVKDMVYDSLQYASQVEETARSHRREVKVSQKSKTIHENGDVKKPNAGEYLTGFYKEDKLLPVITLVVYFGAEKWDAPICLHEMMSITDPELLAFVPDYKINLMTPEGMSDEEIDLLKTSLREVILFIKYSKDNKRLRELIENDIRFQAVEQKASRVINIITGADLKMDESEEKVDMCQAIKEMLEDERQAGIQSGMQAGIETGIQAAHEETIRRMLLKKKYSYEEIADLNDVSVETVKKIEAE